MKIDASRYVKFWTNPERYRLAEIWKLALAEPTPGTFASLLTYGRRRGTCFHEIQDGAYRGVPENEVIQYLKDAGFDEKPIEAAQRMAAKVREVYPDEKYIAHEVVFEYPIPNSPHIMTGRIDHLINYEGETIPGDWKTSKRRSKKDAGYLVTGYCGSAQVGFYLLGCRALGFGEPRRFLYRLLQDRKLNNGVSISQHVAERSGIELRQLAQDVHNTCEIIGFLKQTVGLENPWPTLPERFDRGYASLLGRKMYAGYTPEGFTEKVEHLETMIEDEDDEVTDAV